MEVALYGALAVTLNTEILNSDEITVSGLVSHIIIELLSLLWCIASVLSSGCLHIFVVCYNGDVKFYLNGPILLQMCVIF